MAWRRPGDKPLSEPMMVRLPTHICVTRPQWVNFNYILDKTLSTYPIHYIGPAYDMHQLMDQPTRVDDKTSSVLDVILTSHPTLHRKSAVLKYTLSDHFLIYTHMEFENTKLLVADHNAVKFREMKNFDTESFPNDLISCDILNGSQYNDDISRERWKLAYTDICDKHAPMKTLKTKTKIKSMDDPWNHMSVTKATQSTWWRHQMETFSALLAICAGNSPVPGEFPAQRPVTRSFDVFFDLRLNKRLSKQPWGWWFETPVWSLWRHCNDD